METEFLKCFNQLTGNKRVVMLGLFCVLSMSNKNEHIKKLTDAMQLDLNEKDITEERLTAWIEVILDAAECEGLTAKNLPT